MEKKTRPFGVLDQVGYVCGDMAGSFVNLFVDAYFLTFFLHLRSGHQPGMDGNAVPRGTPVGCNQRPHHGFFPGSLASGKER